MMKINKIYYNGISLLKNIFTKHKFKKLKVLTSKETVDYILLNKSSIVRYGDGELSIMSGKSISFQPYSDELSKRLIEIANSNSNCLVSIPNIFTKESLQRNQLTSEDYNFWTRHLMCHEYKWRRYFQNQSLLGDALISRFYIRYKDKSGVSSYVKKLKCIWDKKDIIFIEGNTSRLGFNNDLFNNAHSVKRILCPNIDAYSRYDEIFEYIKSNINKNCLLIVALGPTATVLCYDLALFGYQALDLGHIDIEYEWSLLQTNKKCPIPNKHVNECNELGDLKIVNDKYKSEIIKSFVGD